MTAGRTLAQFEILEALPEGEFGAVYKARDTASGREVELEVVPAAQGAPDIDRLGQEVKAASALEHWSIAKIFELARAGGVEFLVREHVPGPTLEQALASGPLPPAEALDCARQIAGALAAAHAIGVTHRHLNPRNVILAAQAGVKLVNFGLTPARRDEAYLAPEQLDGRGADARADIFAFGRLLQKLSGPAAEVAARATRRNPARRYQLMEEVQSALEHLADPAAHKHGRTRRLLPAAAVAIVILALLGWWILGGRRAALPAPVRVTSDAGLTTDPAISPDGRTVAYASDRAAAGVLKLWIQPLSGGSATRLTDGAEDDHQPAFAPDGARLVFRSEREGGGLYTIAAAGGAPQFLVEGGRDPRFSPDGRWIAYWSGDPLTPGDAALWVIASHGGTPIRIHSEFADARHPVWSPDGKHLLFAGQSETSRRNRGGDWYVAPFENGSARGAVVRTGAGTLLRMQNLRESDESYYRSGFIIPEAWSAGHVLFSGRVPGMDRDTANRPHLMRIPISDSILQTTGAAHAMTSGLEWDARPSVAANGRIVFSRRTMKPQIWSAPAAASGDLRRIVQEDGEVRFSISGNGKRLAYCVRVADNHNEIRVIEPDSGREIKRIAQDRLSDWPPLLSAAGDELVYSANGLFRVRLPDGEPQRISRRGWTQILSWSADGRRMLVRQGCCSVGLLNPENQEQREFLRQEEAPIGAARFSPDGKWVLFGVLSQPHAVIYLAAVDAPDQRIQVTASDVSSGSPAWAPDGRQVYFVTRCQGFRCIWSRRLDARSRKPQGDPFPVRHLHHARLRLSADPQNLWLAAGEKLIFGMSESTGNIWSLPALPRP